MIHKTLHPRDKIDRLYVSKKEEKESTALKIDWMHQYADTWNALNRVMKD